MVKTFTCLAFWQQTVTALRTAASALAGTNQPDSWESGWYD